MYIVNPLEVTNANTTTNLVNDYPGWTSGTYNQGDRRVVDKVVYEVVASSTTDSPTEGVNKDPASWIVLGYSNRWRMFTLAKDSKSTAGATLTCTFNFGVGVDTIALLGVIGTSINITVETVEKGVVYDETITTTDILVDNYFDWFFLPYESKEDFIFFNLPTYPEATITITVTATSDTAIGRFVAGTSKQLGESIYGSSTGTQSFTLRNRDGFGNLSIVPRRTIDVTEFKVAIETPSIPVVKRYIAKAASEPALFFADPSNEGLINFGLAEDFRIPYEYPTVSKATIEVKSI